jgi:hypothetical protein
MRDLSCTLMIPICSMDETRIPSIYASREDPESESRISRNSILLFFLSKQGCKDEAPPGKFFSGRSIKGSSSWSPAPKGKVWYDHPFLKNGAQYFTDYQYYCVKRGIDFGAHVYDVNPEETYRRWEESMHGAMQYRCPVKKHFMTEAQMLRQEHWFHNGNGSAQQRYFYGQNEMLAKYGGLASLPQF